MRTILMHLNIELHDDDPRTPAEIEIAVSNSVQVPDALVAFPLTEEV